MLALPQHTLELLLVRAGQVSRCVEPALLLRALLLQEMIVACAAALEPAVLARHEAPGSALVGLHLRHFSSTFLVCITCKGARGTGVSRFASSTCQASVSNCCLAASGPLPAFALLGVLDLLGLFLGGHDHDHVSTVQ